MPRRGPSATEYFTVRVRRMELLDPNGRGAGGVGHTQLLRNLEPRYSLRDAEQLIYLIASRNPPGLHRILKRRVEEGS